MKIYFEPRDWWIGYYRGGTHHYACLLPTLVIRWRRRVGTTEPDATAAAPETGMRSRACELCPDPILDRKHRSRCVLEQSWSSPFLAERWAYAHERCYQAALAARVPTEGPSQ
ncbi:MAG TPA: hypothetical protein VFW64_12145 [Pseudonocardiaceae bacterium]|nr:hypothetical protein [Pseudonocardiaceae bacterium]